MKEQPLISVIVPVYKAEKYLDKCINSILSQTYSNLEIILVNDGSPDKSGEMCDRFAEKDGRIRVFHKENGGQSSARNLGLDNMTGDYVSFIDSDDYIEPDMLKTLLDNASDHSAEISACGIARERDGKLLSYFNKDYPENKDILVFSTNEALLENFRNSRLTYSPCDKLYHKSIWENLRMTEGQIYEDMEVIPKCIERAKTVVYDPTPLYRYNLTEQSTIRGKFNPARFAEADVALRKAEDYKIRFPQLYEVAVAGYISVCLYIIHESRGVSSCKERRRSLIAELKKDYPKTVTEKLSSGDSLRFKALKISTVIYEILMTVYDILTKRI